MIPICTKPGTYVLCVDAFNTPLRRGQRYEVDRILSGYDFFEGRDGVGVVLRGAPLPEKFLAYNRRRFIVAELPDVLVRLQTPKPYGERPDLA